MAKANYPTKPISDKGKYDFAREGAIEYLKSVGITEDHPQYADLLDKCIYGLFDVVKPIKY